MLEIRSLSSGYQKIPIIFGVSFQVAAGEFVGILGHNGMGKTTLLKTVVGQLPATSGAIRFAGSDIVKAPAHRRARLGLGYVPQGRQIFPGLSVLDNLRMGAASAGLGDDVLDDVLSALPRLKPILGRAGGVLSGESSRSWRWRVASAVSPSSSCSTSRPRASSPRSSMKSSISCFRSRPSAGSRSCWSNRTSTSFAGCPTAS